MSAQTTYKFGTAMGAAGGIVDLAPYAIDTFMNEEANGAMDFGVAVVKGTKKTQIKKPASGAAAADICGVTVNNRTTEMDRLGNVEMLNNKPVGVMRYGRIYVRVATGVTPAIDDATYALVNGDEAGYFTNASGSGAVTVKGRFLSTVDATTGVAMVELFNQAQ